MEPPNGQRITLADVYEALYEMDGRIADRFGALDRRLNTMQEGQQETGRRLDNHVDGHLAAPSKVQAGGVAGLVTAVILGIVMAAQELWRRL